MKTMGFKDIPWNRVSFIRAPGSGCYWRMEGRGTGRDRSWFLIKETDDRPGEHPFQRGEQYSFQGDMNDLLNEVYESGVEDTKRNVRASIGVLGL